MVLEQSGWVGMMLSFEEWNSQHLVVTDLHLGGVSFAAAAVAVVVEVFAAAVAVAAAAEHEAFVAEMDASLLLYCSYHSLEVQDHSHCPFGYSVHCKTPGYEASVNYCTVVVVVVVPCMDVDPAYDPHTYLGQSLVGNESVLVVVLADHVIGAHNFP